jgi:peroxiredoxin
MVAVGAPAPDVKLLRTDGSATTLRELAAGQPTVLFFLRHYG